MQNPYFRRFRSRRLLGAPKASQKEPQAAPKAPLEAPEGVPGAPKSLSETLRKDPRASLRRPQSTQRLLQRLQELPKASQDVPEAPKSLPKTSPKHPKTLLRAPQKLLRGRPCADETTNDTFFKATGERGHKEVRDHSQTISQTKHSSKPLGNQRGGPAAWSQRSVPGAPAWRPCGVVPVRSPS